MHLKTGDHNIHVIFVVPDVTIWYWAEQIYLYIDFKQTPTQVNMKLLLNAVKLISFMKFTTR